MGAISVLLDSWVLALIRLSSAFKKLLKETHIEHNVNHVISLLPLYFVSFLLSVYGFLSFFFTIWGAESLV